MMQPVFRFAPSPNGFLHLGHAYSALLNADLAARHGGRFLVRIEDIDTRRCRPELVEACLEDLAWLGLEWEEPVLRQSSRFDAYRAVASDLESRGLLYPCFCTRGDILRAMGANHPVDPDGAPVYPGTCRQLGRAERRHRLDSGAAFALRLDMGTAMAATGPLTWREAAGEGLEDLRLIEAKPGNWGDVVLVRKDCPTSYHLAVVVDDAFQGVTHVVRGTDLYAASAIHRTIQKLLGLPEPRYHHHALVTDEGGRKLAKSALSKPLRAWRAEGFEPAQLRARLGFG